MSNNQDLEMPKCACTDIKTGLLIFVVFNLIGGIFTISFRQSYLSGLLSFLFSLFGFYAIYKENVGLMRLFRYLVLASLILFNIAIILYFIFVAQLQKELKDADGNVDPTLGPGFYTYLYVFGVISFIVQNVIKLLLFVQVGKFMDFVEKRAAFAQNHVQMNVQYSQPPPPFAQEGFVGKTDSMQLPPYAYQGQGEFPEPK